MSPAGSLFFFSLHHRYIQMKLKERMLFEHALSFKKSHVIEALPLSVSQNILLYYVHHLLDEVRWYNAMWWEEDRWITKALWHHVSQPLHAAIPARHPMASLWPIWFASTGILVLWGHCGVKWGLPVIASTVIAQQYTWQPTRTWLPSGMDTLDKGDIHTPAVITLPGKEGYFKLTNCYFWNFLINIFGSLLPEIIEGKTEDKRELQH